MKKILVSGLGGGLDIINASLVYFALQNEVEDVEIVLGSSRPAPLFVIDDHNPFSDCGTWINKESVIHYGRPGRIPRYAEPKISALLEEEILFLSRKYESENNVSKLRESILEAKKKYDFSPMIFVDGGGDSLTFHLSDAFGTSENETDVFQGGDSIVLEALSGIENTYLAVIAMGLDISQEGFLKNLKLLKENDAYFGRVNLQTLEKDEYKLDDIVKFDEGFLSPYFDLAEKILVINEKDLDNPYKTQSHTAVITYHALKGNYGIKRTFVPWELETDGRPGEYVKPEHSWMYFFDAAKIHEIKVELNR